MVYIRRFKYFVMRLLKGILLLVSICCTATIYAQPQKGLHWSVDGNSYYELGASDSLNYISVGATDLSLSVNFIYKDQSNLNEKGRTATQEDFKEIAEEYQTTFSAADTTATVKNGEVTVINKAYRP